MSNSDTASEPITLDEPPTGLRDADAALWGALAAVEALKRALGVGVPADPDALFRGLEGGR